MENQQTLPGSRPRLFGNTNNCKANNINVRIEMVKLFGKCFTITVNDA